MRLRASSLNYHDYMVATGAMKAEDGRIPLSDGAGEVLAIGEGVSEFAVGDHVVSTFFPTWLDGANTLGGFAAVPGDGIDGYAREEVTTAATSFTRMPKGYDFAEAATLTCAGVTAWRALVTDGPLIAGQWVLVQGTGGVSIFALQIAKAMGARVIATSSSDAKLERLVELGADHVLNYRTQQDWGEQARRISGGGVHHVIEVGGAGTLTQSIIAARNCGHIALIGVLAGVEGNVPTVLLMGKQIRLQGLTVGSRRDQIDFIAAIEATGLRPVIDERRFALEDLAKAFAYEKAGGHFGKICITI